jgi:hypothetical protein
VAVRASELRDEPPPVEIIEGIVSEGGVTIFPAESGTGKTFVLIDMAAAADDGPTWRGRAVERCSVAYVMFEGDAIGLRIRAICEVRGHRMENVYIIRANEPISPLMTREGEVRSIGEIRLTRTIRALGARVAHTDHPLRLMVIDTARASMTGSEDSSESVAGFMRSVRRINAAVPGMGCIVAHHAGWQDGENQRKRERGSSAWRGNCDATVYLELEDYCADTGAGRLVLRTLKSRDGEKLPPLHLIRQRVQLAGVDRRGRPLTSCVIHDDTRTREDREAEAQADADREHQEIDLRTLRAIVEHPEAATSQDRLRAVLGARKTVVKDSVSRLMRAALVLPGRQRQPYQITAAGLAWLDQNPVVPTRSRLVPGLVPSRSPGSPLWGTGNYSDGPSESFRDGSDE